MKKKECPSCAMEIDANSKECPICSYEFPSTGKGYQIVALLLVIILVLFWVIF